jgi:HlyD family secretion protein
MRRIKPAHLAVGAAIACALVGNCAGKVASRGAAGPSSATQGTQVEPEAVVAMGRIEPVDGVIDVGATLGDRLGRLLVKEGADVEKGQPLAELESRPLRQLELEAATNQWENAKGRLAVDQRLADVKIAAAKLNVKKAETAQLSTAAQREKVALLAVNLALAKKDQQRLQGLSKDLATDQERERHSLLVEQAESELNSARAMLRQFLRTNELGLEAAMLEIKAAEEAKAELPWAIPVESLRAGRELADTLYRRTQVIAPCKGTILKTYVRPGETISTRPVLQMANLERMVVVAEVYEDEIKHIRPGQPVVVTSKAFPAPFDQQELRGKVTQIGRMINSPMLKSVDPFAPADHHVVEVRVELDDQGSRKTAGLSNLQVDVRFPKEGTEVRE